MSSPTGSPYGGEFGGDPYRAGRGTIYPTVVTVEATRTPPYAAIVPAPIQGGRLLRRVYIRGPAGSVARLHVGDPSDVRAVRDVTFAGDEDTAEYSPEIFVSAGAALAIVWDIPAAATAAAAFATFEWVDL